MFLYLQIITLIANILAIAVIARAFIEAQIVGRLIISAGLVLSFIVPQVWAGRWISLIFFIARLSLAMGCYVYLKWSQVSIF